MANSATFTIRIAIPNARVVRTVIIELPIESRVEKPFGFLDVDRVELDVVDRVMVYRRAGQVSVLW